MKLADDEQPPYRRRLTKSPDTGSNASPVGRIRFLNLDDARNERLATPRQDRGHGVAAAIAIKIANVRAFAQEIGASHGRAAGCVWT